MKTAVEASEAQEQLAKLKIDDIRKVAIEHGWTLISTEYKNLDTELIFECNEGHRVYAPYKKIRDKWECPICKQNKYFIFSEEIKPKRKGVRRTLALDQATHITGYAILDNNELINAGIFETTKEDEIERDLEVKNWLIQMINNWNPDMVVMEDIQLQQINGKTIGVTTYRTLARLQGILLATCVEQNMSWTCCPPATWRAYCGVKGRTRTDKKRSMQNLIKEWYDVTVSDDIADAIGIGKWASEKVNKQVVLVNWE